MAALLLGAQGSGSGSTLLAAHSLPGPPHPVDLEVASSQSGRTGMTQEASPALQGRHKVTEGGGQSPMARLGAGVGPLEITSAHLLIMLACAFVFLSLTDTFLAFRQRDFKQEVYFKLYLCLRLVFLSGELEAHLASLCCKCLHDLACAQRANSDPDLSPSWP